MVRVCVGDTVGWFNRDGVCVARAARRGTLIVADVFGPAGYWIKSFEKWAGAAKWIENMIENMV